MVGSQSKSDTASSCSTAMGIMVRSSGIQKTQYFVGLDTKRATATIKVGDREYQELFIGLMMKYMIEGLEKQAE